VAQGGTRGCDRARCAPGAADCEEALEARASSGTPRRRDPARAPALRRAQAPARAAQGGARTAKKSHSVLFRSKGDIFAFVEQERDRFSVDWLCRKLGVSRAGYYAWRTRKPSRRSREDEALSRRIEALHGASHGTYGSPRIHALLRRAGTRVSRKRVVRLMRRRGLRARAARLYRRKPRALPPSAPYRPLDAAPSGPNQLWVGDVTYLRSAGRWRYLAAIMDRYSRRIIGWQLAPHRTSALTTRVLRDAVRRRKPPAGLVFHSDRGVEYAAYPYRDLLARHGIVQSMNRPRGMGDNACMESFFHSLKADRIHGERFDDDAALQATIASYIPLYNRHRLHSSLGYRSPVDYERRHA